MKQERGKKMTFDKTVKNKTMEELVFKDIAKESHLTIDNNSGIIMEKEIPIIGREQLTYQEQNKHNIISAQEKEIQKWIEYNKSVLKLDTKYSEGIELINGDILVKLFKKPITDKYGFYKPYVVHYALRNGAGAST